MKFTCEKCGHVNNIDTAKNKSQRRLMQEKREADPDYGQHERKEKRKAKKKAKEEGKDVP